MPTFRCTACGADFDLPQHVVDRYPGWTPSRCRSCRDDTPAARTTPPAASADDGVFTDGSADPNPGQGGWGAVWVRDGEIVDQRSGGEPDTTNNRMELRALIEGAKMIPDGTKVTLWSDSNLAVRTVNEWAAGWERRGWTRKTGPVQNLDLVQELYAIAKARPELTIRWIKGHAGHRWNEYADGLANLGRTSS